MDQKQWQKHYRRLCGISENSADIWGSEFRMELFRTAGCSETAALKMQLEQEHFFRLLDGWDTLEDLRERLGPYTETERRGILLYILEGVNGGAWTQKVRLRAVRLPLPELESRTAAAMEYAARQLCTDLTVPDCGEAVASYQQAAAAAAIAVYVETPGETPEEIAAVSAEAAASAAGYRGLLPRLVSSLLFLLLSPFRLESAAAVQTRLLSLLALFLNEFSFLTGCSVVIPAVLPVLAAPVTEDAPEEAAEEEFFDSEPEQEIFRERA